MKKIMFSDAYALTEAVLSGRKTQTRRIVKVDVPLGSWSETMKHSRYKVGEVVAVAQRYSDFMPTDKVLYQSVPEFGGYLKQKASDLKGWSNKMFVCADLMPHRIRITNVRVERLNEISDDDCLREGIIKGKVGSEDTHFMDAYYAPNIPLEPHVLPQGAYAALIDRISRRGTFESNPWVFVYDFELVK